MNPNITDTKNLEDDINKMIKFENATLVDKIF